VQFYLSVVERVAATVCN